LKFPFEPHDRFGLDFSAAQKSRELFAVLLAIIPGDHSEEIKKAEEQ
jgi:hypothetical protein